MSELIKALYECEANQALTNRAAQEIERLEGDLEAIVAIEEDSPAAYRAARLIAKGSLDIARIKEDLHG